MDDSQTRPSHNEYIIKGKFMIASQPVDRRESPQIAKDQQKHKLDLTNYIVNKSHSLKNTWKGIGRGCVFPAGVIFPISLICRGGSMVNN